MFKLLAGAAAITIVLIGFGAAHHPTHQQAAGVICVSIPDHVLYGTPLFATCLPNPL